MTDIAAIDPAAFTTVALDFDGVLHPYTRGWHDGTCYDPPAPEAVDAVRGWMEFRPVAIMTARPLAPVAAWLTTHMPDLRFVVDHHLEWDHWARRDVVLVTNRKIVAAHYVDDRAIRFSRHGGPDYDWSTINDAITHWDSEYAERHRQGVTG